MQKPSQSKYLLCCSQNFCSIIEIKLKENAKTTILTSDTSPSTLRTSINGSTGENHLINKHSTAFLHFEALLTSTGTTSTGEIKFYRTSKGSLWLKRIMILEAYKLCFDNAICFLAQFHNSTSWNLSKGWKHVKRLKVSISLQLQNLKESISQHIPFLSWLSHITFFRIMFFLAW